MTRTGIYRIANTVTGDFYIGSSTDIVARWGRHRNELRKGVHSNARLQRAWNKYGEPAFEFSVMEECPRGILREKEQTYLDNLQPPYNLAPTVTNGMFGRRHSPETRMRMSASAKGRKFSDEARRKSAERARLGLPHRGHHHSEETRKLLSEQRKGGKIPPEQLARRRGRPGRPLTPENLEKLLAGQRAWRARLKETSNDDTHS